MGSAINGTYRFARTEEAAKTKLYKLLAGAEESKPENITVAKHLEDYLQYRTSQPETTYSQEVQGSNRRPSKTNIRHGQAASTGCTAN
jgi:hypothetical protein